MVTAIIAKLEWEDTLEKTYTTTQNVAALYFEKKISQT
jgi:hypothetical protein